MIWPTDGSFLGAAQERAQRTRAAIQSIVQQAEQSTGQEAALYLAGPVAQGLASCPEDVCLIAPSWSPVLLAAASSLWSSTGANISVISDLDGSSHTLRRVKFWVARTLAVGSDRALLPILQQIGGERSSADETMATLPPGSVIHAYWGVLMAIEEGFVTDLRGRTALMAVSAIAMMRPSHEPLEQAIEAIVPRESWDWAKSTMRPYGMQWPPKF